jgi:hypothetical protein
MMEVRVTSTLKYVLALRSFLVNNLPEDDTLVPKRVDGT